MTYKEVFHRTPFDLSPSGQASMPSGLKSRMCNQLDDFFFGSLLE